MKTFDRLTDIQKCNEQMNIYNRNLYQKFQLISLIAAEKHTKHVLNGPADFLVTIIELLHLLNCT